MSWLVVFQGPHRHYRRKLIEDIRALRNSIGGNHHRHFRPRCKIMKKLPKILWAIWRKHLQEFLATCRMALPISHKNDSTIFFCTYNTFCWLPFWCPLHEQKIQEVFHVTSCLCFWNSWCFLLIHLSFRFAHWSQIKIANLYIERI